MLDYLIKHSLIYDGSGKPPISVDLGIANDRISYLGVDSQQTAGKTIDATGLILAPGFIDSHTHADGYILTSDSNFLGKIWQGVTSELFGNCGISVFPNLPGHEQSLYGYFGPFAGPYHLDWKWTDYASLVNSSHFQDLENNAGSFVGHGSLRIAVMDFAQRKPTSAEMDQMTRMMEDSFSQGAVGLTLGLMYPPGLYADTDELTGFARVAARHDKPVTVHMRNETFHLIESVQEIIEIAQRSGARFVISHLKAVGRKNWGKVQRAVELIDQARSRGVDIYCDAYPYTAGNTVLRALLPPWALEGGVNKMLERLKKPEMRKEMISWMEDRDDWENLSLAAGWDTLMIQTTKSQHQYEGRYIEELAREKGVAPIEFVFDLLLEEDGDVTMLLFTASEDDLLTAFRQPYCMIVSDGIPAATHPHPRLYGTFPRFISRYVLEQKIMPMEEGIRRITALPAQVYQLANRGRLAEGYIADIVAFDPNTFRDNATFAQPEQYSAGIQYLFENGQEVIAGGKLTNTLAGRALNH